MKSRVRIALPDCWKSLTQIFACFITRMEVLDRAWNDEGNTFSRLADEQLQSLPIQLVH